MIVDKTAATLEKGDVLSNNGAVIDQVVLCGHGESVYIRAKFDDGYTQVVTVPASTPITTWVPDPKTCVICGREHQHKIEEDFQAGIEAHAEVITE